MIVDSFEGQREDEDILAVWRQHPWVLTRPAIFVIIILAILIAAGIWYWQSRSIAPTGESTQQSLDNNTTSAIQNDLDNVDTGADLEKEMNQQLDADINSL